MLPQKLHAGKFHRAQTTMYVLSHCVVRIDHSTPPHRTVFSQVGHVTQKYLARPSTAGAVGRGTPGGAAHPVPVRAGYGSATPSSVI